MRSRVRGVVLAGWLCGLVSSPAGAMINPSFTPIHLVNVSVRILAGKLGASSQPDHWAFEEVRILKGKGEGGIRFSLAIAGAAEATSARDAIRSCVGCDVVLFQGRYWGTEPGLLLVRNTWFTLNCRDEREWQIAGFSEQMYKTYNGSADKLAEMVEYILRDDDPDVPVAVGIKWRDRIRIARMSEGIGGMSALGGGPGRRARLFVASTRGDRLFELGEDAKAFADLTVDCGLDTASRAFAFVDLNGDGRADLVSWDGRAVKSRLRRSDGGFSRPAGGGETEWQGPCDGLAVISPAQDGAPGVLVSAGWPSLLAWTGNGWVARPLPGNNSRDKPAAPGPACVVADLDADGFTDVLQLRDKDSLLWKGKKGGYEEPATCEVRAGGLPARWCVGDFDTDGRLDLFVSGRDASELWENGGAGRFRPVIQYAGSLQVKKLPRAADCLATDLNHDGRPDLAVLYPTGQFYYHFNRGYRCLGEEGELTLDLAETPDGPPVPLPAGRAAAGDFDGDGSTDLAVVGSAGEVFCFLSNLSQASGVWLALPPGRVGPVTVSVWQGDDFPICVGTHVVEGHSPATYAPLRRPGHCTLKWRWPGGPLRQLQAKDNSTVVLPLDKGP